MCHPKEEVSMKCCWRICNDEVDDGDGDGLPTDPWWTIHFGGRANHVGTSHIPLCSNFNRHIFITRITSNHIILTYPLQATSDQNCHKSRLITKYSFSFSVPHDWRSTNLHTKLTPEKTTKISSGKCFLYLCVFRFSASAGQGMNENTCVWQGAFDKRRRHRPCFPGENYQQEILGWIGKKWDGHPYGGNIICRVILVSPFPLVLAGSQLLTCPSLIQT